MISCIISDYITNTYIVGFFNYWGRICIQLKDKCFLKKILKKKKKKKQKDNWSFYATHVFRVPIKNLTPLRSR